MGGRLVVPTPREPGQTHGRSHTPASAPPARGRRQGPAGSIAPHPQRSAVATRRREMANGLLGRTSPQYLACCLLQVAHRPLVLPPALEAQAVSSSTRRATSWWTGASRRRPRASTQPATSSARPDWPRCRWSRLASRSATPSPSTSRTWSTRLPPCVCTPCPRWRRRDHRGSGEDSRGRLRDRPRPILVERQGQDLGLSGGDAQARVPTGGPPAAGCSHSRARWRSQVIHLGQLAPAPAGPDPSVHPHDVRSAHSRRGL